MNKLNEDFTNLYKRWKGGEVRKEDKFDYKLVDLGLPSGTLWMDRNIGAKTVVDDGGYYAWGETEEKDYYLRDTYKYIVSKTNTTKYNKKDGKTVLEHEDDVVYLKTKGKCHIPSKEQIEELLKETNNKWVDDYKGSGVNGRLFTGSNGNSIFIPASGYKAGSDLSGRGDNFYVWSASLYESYDSGAWLFHSDLGNVGLNTGGRSCGLSVRGVLY